MPINIIPDWFSSLEDEDVNFIKRFILASGSLKEIANQYEVSYPTVRLKLDKLIKKIEANDTVINDPFVSLVRQLTLNEKIDLDTAKILISEHKKKED